jgi:hypothetical protein
LEGPQCGAILNRLQRAYFDPIFESTASPLNNSKPEPEDCGRILIVVENFLKGFDQRIGSRGALVTVAKKGAVLFANLASQIVGENSGSPHSHGSYQARVYFRAATRRLREKEAIEQKSEARSPKKESKRAEIDQIRRCLALRPELRTNFLRKRIANGMSAL